MCVIIGPVRKVARTRIFVAPSLDRQRQLTAYSNEVAADQETMMILPTPFPETIQFHESVMRYKDLFKDLESSLYRPVTLSASASRGPPTLSALPREPLPVLDVGSYKVSVAPSLEDLGHLNADIFPLSADVLSTLEREYGGQPWGFICCVMRPGSNRYEPIVYSHRAIDGHLFVPTLHHHEVAGAYAPTEYMSQGQRYAEDWDHEIYSVGTAAAEAHAGGSAIPRATNEVRWRAFPTPFQHSKAAPIHLWERTGVWPNKDLMFPLVPPRQSPLQQPQSQPRLRTSSSSSSFEKLFAGLRGAFR